MKQYGIVGHPLGHSFSKTFFTEKFSKEGIQAEYLNFDISDISHLTEVLETHPHLCGLNVTLPYKEEIIPYLDALDENAKEIGAVNVVRIDPDGTLKGFNSDIIGFTESLRPLLRAHHKSALILGTGGASRAVKVGLKRLDIEWKYVSRHAQQDILDYQMLNDEILSAYTLIVNCTPLGMFPNEDSCPDIPYEFLTSRHLLFDLVYNPEESLFLRKGKAQGCTTCNGLEMLHLQAVASWNIWNSKG